MVWRASPGSPDADPCSDGGSGGILLARLKRVVKYTAHLPAITYAQLPGMQSSGLPKHTHSAQIWKRAAHRRLSAARPAVCAEEATCSVSETAT
jgi:hypothetical protein